MFNSKEWFFIILFCLVIAGFIIFGIVMETGNQQYFTATVNNTIIDEGKTYFVLTKDDGSSCVYENRDAPFFGKWNSADFLMNLESGKTYRFFTMGYRKPFWSFFPNIISYVEIPN